MTANLMNHEALAHIEAGITQNRDEAGSLVSVVLAGDIEAGKRMNLLNTAWCDLEQAKQDLTRIPFAPYRMGR